MPIPFVPGENVLELTARYIELNQQIVNVFHVHNSIPWTLAHINACLDTYITWVQTDGKYCMGTGCTFVSTTGRDLTTKTSTIVDKLPLAPVEGTQMSGCVVQAVTAVVSWRTAQSGRSYRGRTYVPGLPAEWVENGYLKPAAMGTLKTHYEALYGTMSLDTWELGVFSRMSDKVYRTQGVFTPVSHVVVGNQLGVQRRRLPGRGK